MSAPPSRPAPSAYPSLADADAAGLIGRLTGYELRPAPELEQRMDASPVTQDAEARSFSRDGTTLGAVLLIPYPHTSNVADQQDFLTASLDNAKQYGNEASITTIDGVPAVEAIGSARTKAWSLPLGRFGLIVTGENAASTDVTRQMIRILEAA